MPQSASLRVSARSLHVAKNARSTSQRGLVRHRGWRQVLPRLRDYLTAIWQGGRAQGPLTTQKKTGTEGVFRENPWGYVGHDSLMLRASKRKQHSANRDSAGTSQTDCSQ